MTDCYAKFVVVHQSRKDIVAKEVGLCEDDLRVMKEASRKTFESFCAVLQGRRKKDFEGGFCMILRDLWKRRLMRLPCF